MAHFLVIHFEEEVDAELSYWSNQLGMTKSQFIRQVLEEKLNCIKEYPIG